MFVQSNDLFYAPDGEGIALFNEAGEAFSGDITEQFLLWDAGTEENEQPGVGLNQAPRQSGPNVGPIDPNNAVRLVDDAFSYPPASAVLLVTLNQEISTSVEDLLDPQNSAVSSFSNFPNPFDKETEFQIELAEQERLNLAIFDLFGRKIREVLPTKLLPAGTHQFSWDGKDEQGNSLTPGIYFARLNGFDQGISTLRVMIQE